MAQSRMMRTASVLFVGLLSLILGIGNVYAAKPPIKIGFISIFSGRVAMLGETGKQGVQLAIDEINAKGGVLGRKLELISRDTGGKPEEAVRIAKSFFTTEKVAALIDGSSSHEAFAVLEVARTLKKLVIATATETTEYTANPKVRSRYAFRCARQGVHDGIVAGYFAAKISKKLGLKKWYSISPDYAYGHDNTNTFFTYLKQNDPDIQIIGQQWPKLFQPDYTAFITKTMQDKPQACYSSLWGGDLTSFLDQANMYGLFSRVKFFSENIADPLVLKGLKGGVPAGMYTSNRYNPTMPDTPANHAFAKRFEKKYGVLPSNWSWQGYTAVLFLSAAMKKAGTTNTEKVIDALEGLSVKAPCAQPPHTTVTMRKKDHQIIYYTIGWAETTSKPPYVTDRTYVPWKTILKEEAAYYKAKGWE